MHCFCVVLDNVGSTQHCFVKLGKDCLQEIMRGIKKAERDAVGCVFYIKLRGVNEESSNHKKIKLDPSLLPEQNKTGHWIKIDPHRTTTKLELPNSGSTLGNEMNVYEQLCISIDNVCRIAQGGNIPLNKVISRIRQRYKGTVQFIHLLYYNILQQTNSLSLKFTVTEKKPSNELGTY